MASTYTSRIRLELQADGENPNSWGTILNDGVINLIDAAFAAYTTVSLSSADKTLSNNDGASDESRSAMLEFVGTVSSDVNVVMIELPDKTPVLLQSRQRQVLVMK